MKMDIDLKIASLHNLKDVIVGLEEEGAIRIPIDYSSIKRAYRNGHMIIVKELLINHKVIELCLDSISWVFKEACKDGILDIVELALKIGGLSEEDQFKGLRLASKQNHRDIVQLLINNGLDVNKDDSAAFCLACKHGHFELVKDFLSAGVRLDSSYGFALAVAGEFGHLHIVKELLKLPT